MNSFPARDAQRRAFLSETDFAGSRLVPIQQDASFRRYFRLDDGEHGWLLMDAPPQTENLTSWLDIGKHLTDLGLRAPAACAPMSPTDSHLLKTSEIKPLPDSWMEARRLMRFMRRQQIFWRIFTDSLMFLLRR